MSRPLTNAGIREMVKDGLKYGDGYMYDHFKRLVAEVRRLRRELAKAKAALEGR